MWKQRLALAAAIVAAWTPAAAADAEGNWITGSLWVELQYDRIYSADDDSDGSDLFTKIEPEVLFHFTPELHVRAVGVLEPVLDRVPEEHRLFEDHGAYLETLVLVYETDRFGAYGGKFTPIFGLHDAAPGMYGDSFMSDYELTERLGLGGAVHLDADGFGTATIHASAFTADTSAFSGSAITDRGRIRRGDGGTGNTGGLENVALAVDLKPAALDGFTLRAAFLRQGHGEGDDADQHAVEVGAAYKYDVTDALTVLPMVDWVHSWDAPLDLGGSLRGAEQDHLTLGIAAEHGPWFGILSGGLRLTDTPGADDADDSFVQVSGGYVFDFGVAVEVGWVASSVDAVDARTVGVLASYGVEF